MSENEYGIGLLDDLHNFFPDILYNRGRFHNVQDLLHYIGDVARQYTPAIYEERPVLDIPSSDEEASSTSNRRPREEEEEDGDGANPRPATRMRIITTTTQTIINPSSLLSHLMQPTHMRERFNIDNLLSSALLMESIPSSFFDPIPIVPTEEQIENSSHVEIFRDEHREQVCSICQEQYKESDLIRTLLHCDHPFHASCIDLWLCGSAHCPLCRHDIREYGEGADDADSIS